MYKITTSRLNLKLNSNQIKSLNKFNGICGIKNNTYNNINEDKNKDIKLDEENEKAKKKWNRNGIFQGRY